MHTQASPYPMMDLCIDDFDDGIPLHAPTYLA